MRAKDKCHQDPSPFTVFGRGGGVYSTGQGRGGGVYSTGQGKLTTFSLDPYTELDSTFSSTPSANLDSYRTPRDLMYIPYIPSYIHDANTLSSFKKLNTNNFFTDFSVINIIMYSVMISPSAGDCSVLCFVKEAGYCARILFLR